MVGVPGVHPSVASAVALSTTKSPLIRAYRSLRPAALVTAARTCSGNRKTPGGRPRAARRTLIMSVVESTSRSATTRW